MSNPLAATAKNRRWVLFWIVWSFLLSAVYGILGSDSYLRIRDAADSDFSNQIIAAKDFLAHGFTFWNPHLGGGLASWMSQQVDSLFLTVPFLFLPPWAAYALIMGLQRFVAGYFCYRLFLRLNIGQIASLFGGILFSLNSWNVDDWTLSDGFGPPATPLYLYLFDRLLDLPSKKLALALSGCLGILIGIGGSAAHFTPFFLVFLPLWFLIVRRVSILKTWPFFISLTIGAILAEGPESWALYSFSLDSTRILIPPSTDSGFPSLLAQTKDYFSHILAIPMWGFLVVALAGFFLHGKNDGLFKKALILFALFLLFQPVSSWSFFLLSLKMPYTGGNIMDLRQFSF
ncbi:MAG TPA: hypothetical protein HPQ00_14340, partial [Magnetococcales bacterium]|nr:hypothetical protein [Magnetococcales bacterium]